MLSLLPLGAPLSAPRLALTRPDEQLSLGMFAPLRENLSAAMNVSLPLAIDKLRELLEASHYSQRLYGFPGLVNTATLQIIYTDLLDPAALAAVNASVLSPRCSESCCWQGHRRYHAGRLAVALPPGAVYSPLWGPTNSFYVTPRAVLGVPSHSWVEAVHCPFNTSFSKARLSMGAWFYVTPGSNVSVNVGKTMVVEEGMLLDDVNMTVDSINDMLEKFWTPGVNHLARFLGLTDEERFSLDSIQRINHRECSDRVVHHEIVISPSKLIEHEHFLAARGGVVRCGVHPHLEECQPDMLVAKAMHECSRW